MNLVGEFYGLTLDTPTIILPLFLSTMLTVHVQQLGGTARVIRADCGTENGYVAAVQRFIRRDDEDDWAGDDSFIYEESVSHQRIEAWRSILGKDCTIVPYKPLYGLFSASNFAFLSLGHPLEYASLQCFYAASLNNLHTGFVSGLLVLKKSLLTRAL